MNKLATELPRALGSMRLDFLRRCVRNSDALRAVRFLCASEVHDQ